MSKTEELQPVKVYSDLDAPVRFRRHATYLDTDKNRDFWETWNIPDIDPKSSDKYHYVEAGQEGFRGITYLSYLYYGRVDLWWVIAVANGMFNPEIELVAGIELRVPDKYRVMSLLV